MRRSLLLILLFSASCGSPQPPQAPGTPAAEAPASRQEAGFASPESAEDEEHAPDSLAPAPPPEPGEGGVTSAGEPRPGDARLERQPASVEEALAQLEAETESLDAALEASELSDRCGRACRALGSMERAVGGVCELAGEEDRRCDRARDRYARSERRVAQAGCRC